MNSDTYQYRITVNGTQSEITDYDTLTPRWTRIAELYDSRGGIDAVLERRLITTTHIYKFGVDPVSYINLPGTDVVVCPWEVIAAMVG